MKFYKKVLSILLILMLFIQIISPIVFAADSDTTKYLALGDSIAYGYGLQDRDTESYSQIVRSKRSISKNNFSNLAVSGMTCAEFYKIIQTTDYTNAIKSANLITISIGSNELLKLAIKIVAKNTGVAEDDAEFLAKVQQYFIQNPLKVPSTIASLYADFTSNETKQELNEHINIYKTNWDKSVAYIKKINPNATIIATQFYNPYYEVGLSSYDLGTYVAEFIDKMNIELENSSKSESLYKIAKIHDDFDTTSPRLTNVNISISNFNFDPHPNKNGHNIIATRILDVLKTIDSQKTDIKGLTFSTIDDYTYTGSEIKPKIVIKNNTTTLKENTDYTLTYVNNIKVGQASIIIKGIGNYSGTVTKTFNIKSAEVKKQTNISSLTFSKIEDQTYVGYKITPDVTILDDKTTLKLNTDYQLTYYNNINAGTASIKVTGIGDYTGNKELTFKILQKNISTVSISDIESQSYSGKELTPKPLLTDGSHKLVENTDYKITYSNNIEVGNATVTISGLGNYTGSTKKTFKITKTEEIITTKDISKLKISDIEDKIYTGKVITPEVTIYDGETLLTKDQDYTLSYADNFNVGTATLTITGKRKLYWFNSKRFCYYTKKY